MRIVRIDDEGDEGRWGTFISSRTTSITDLLDWRRVVYEAYSLRSHFLGALRVDEPVGVLGLYQVRHKLFGHYLATAPFGTDGGLIADGPDVATLLAGEARRLADQLGVDYLVIRTRGTPLEGFVVDERYCTAIINLNVGSEHLWTDVLPAKTRNQIRRGRKEGFVITEGADEIAAFNHALHTHMRDLGSPAHSLRFYRLIARHLRDRARFVVVRDGDALAAGALVFSINGTASNMHTVALRRYNRRCPNYLIYWHMLESSIAAGCTAFDMGRSVVDSSNLVFKKNWNPRIVPLAYNYYLRNTKEIPFMDPRNARYRLAIAAWRRLPLAATRLLGPRLITGLV